MTHRSVYKTGSVSISYQNLKLIKRIFENFRDGTRENPTKLRCFLLRFSNYFSLYSLDVIHSVTLCNNNVSHSLPESQNKF